MTKVKILLFILSVLLTTPSYSQQPKYRGKIIYEFVDNGVANTEFSAKETFLYDDFVVEKQYKLVQYTNKDSKGHVISSSGADVPDFITLSNIRLKQCIDFSVSDTPHVIKKYPLKDKQLGLNLTGEIPDIKNEIRNFVFFKDTVIDRQKVTILIDSGFKLPDGSAIKTAKIYLNHNLPSSPIHLISEQIDQKYQGVATRLSFIFENSYKLDLLTGIDTNLNEQEQAIIKKYIQLFNQSTSESK
jgi:hypothetical protein